MTDRASHPHRRCVASTLVMAVASLVLSGGADAAVSAPRIFGDHMVLQQGGTIPVWGWADPGEQVTVTFAGATATATAGADRRWRADLPPAAADDRPQRLTIASAANTLTFDDVVVGDVWVCSGQSNMEFGLGNIAHLDRAAAAVDPAIRTFCVLKTAALEPLDDLDAVPADVGLDTDLGHWQKEAPAGPWNGFSAVGYLFGKELRQVTGRPIGLIGAYWGGTAAQAWAPLTSLEREPTLQNYVDGMHALGPEQRAYFPVHWPDYVTALRTWDREVREPFEAAQQRWPAEAQAARDAGRPEPPAPQLARPRPAAPHNEWTPGTLFNGMINPLIPSAISGVIWYQGEANSYNGDEYGVMFPALIKGWRERWGRADLPFLFVQLAGFRIDQKDPNGGRWASVRRGQQQALALPRTGMATAIDVGQADDIHPPDKFTVAHRLALLARRLVYGEDVVAAGPMFAGARVDGRRVIVAFTQSGSGLVIGAPPALPGEPPRTPPSALTGFEIAGADHAWVPATAVIDGETVVVTSDQVAEPAAVRSCWADYPACSLYNREGLPAYPFQADVR